MTTVHSRTDTRIRLKQVTTLAKEFHKTDVKLYVQDGLGDERDSAGFDIVDTGARSKKRLNRMTGGAWRMYKSVKLAQPQIVHFHDPELIPVGILLKFSGMKVIYDVHENLSKQILTKPYIPIVLRKPMSLGISMMEWVTSKIIDAVAPATPSIAKNWPIKKTTLVQNFPILGELESSGTPYAQRPSNFAFVGGITEIRGIHDMVSALSLVDDKSIKLMLVGEFNPISLKDKVSSKTEWSKVDYKGWANRKEVAEILGVSVAGLVLYHPAPNHIDAQPNKLFEYMSAGIPIIGSHFPMWRTVIEGNECGLVADPQNPKEIANAMQWMVDNPKEAEEMGKRGQKAIIEKYSWNVEAMKLVALYRSLLVKN